MRLSKRYTMPLSVLPRRDALKLLGGGLASFGALSAFGGVALGDAAAVAERLKAVTRGADVGGDSIVLDIPEIAENGNAVKVGFEVDSPMSASDYVKAVHIFVDGNPQPEVARFNFSPANGVCRATTRMRLAKTQNVFVLAEMSDGAFKQASGEIKVTIGGCGG